MRMTLEGRVAGPWVVELDRVWAEASLRLGTRKLTIDLHDVTYVDAAGKSVLIKILSHTGAELIAGSLETRELANELISKYQLV